MGKEDKRFEIVYKEGSLSGVKILKDKETGVHYVFSWDGYAGGMTPLLDENGNVTVNK